MRAKTRWLLMAAVLLTPPAALAELQPEQPKLPPELPFSDTNSCVEGTIAGGLIGAGIGGFATRGRARWVGVPVGAVGGALLGCQIDGG